MEKHCSAVAVISGAPWAETGFLASLLLTGVRRCHCHCHLPAGKCRRQGGAGLEGAGQTAMGCGEAPIPPSKEILDYLLLAAHLTLPSLGTDGVPVLAPSQGSSLQAGDPDAPQGTGFLLCLSRILGAWMALWQPCLHHLVLLEHPKLWVGGSGCSGLRWLQWTWVGAEGSGRFQATEKERWFCCGLGGFLQLSPGVLEMVEGPV